MRKVNLKRVLEALTTNSPGSSSNASGGNSATGKKDPDFGENLTGEQFQPCKIVRHGFPHRPTAIAYDPVQKLLAVGNYCGSIRILGQPGVDCHVTHDTDSPVIQLLFLANQGALVSVCADDTVHLWNLRQKKPAILHSLKFSRERLTYCYVPYQSSWIYIGTERGNTHMCNIESFTLSGYSINWNKAIDLSQKSHPGTVVSICENPIDQNKVLIAFDSGFVVLWDLKNRSCEQRYYSTSGVHSLTWHFEGKQFMCCHRNGSLTLWNYKNSSKPVQLQFPHAKSENDVCHPIEKVAWLSSRNGDAFIIFSGGLSTSISPTPQPSVTIMRGRSITVLEMDFPVIDFVPLTSTPWTCDFQDPTALVALLEKELVVVDLEAPGYPCIELDHVMDIHDSPVTCLKYIPDANTDLMPGLYQVAASKSHRVESSKKEWPISGGEWSVEECDGIPEIIVTGHADGSIRFWDASAVSLKALYKLRTYKIFRRESEEAENDEDDPFRITNIDLCPESRILVTSNISSTVTIFKFNSQEAKAEIPCLNLSHVDESLSTPDSVVENGPNSLPVNSIHPESKDATGPTAETDADTKMSNNETQDSIDSQSEMIKQESNASVLSGRQASPLLRVKNGVLRQSAGFHVELVCLILGTDLNPPTTVTYLAVNTQHQILSFGTISSLYVIDMMQKTCLLNMSTDNLLQSIDKRFQPRSPNKLKPGGFADQSSFSFDHSTAKSPTEDYSEVNVKGLDVKSKRGGTTKKTRLTRKSIGDYFSITNSPMRIRRSSVFAKTPMSANIHGPLCPLVLGEPVNGISLSLPAEGEVSPNSNEDPFDADAAKVSKVRFMLGEEEESAKKTEEEKTIIKRDPCNGGQSHPPLSFHLSSGGKVGKESSLTSVGSQKSKKPQHRLYKKAGSFSFEKSMDSTTSVDDGTFSRGSSFSDAERTSPCEMVTYITFANTYARKNDNNSFPCLWVGTSSGYVFSIVLNLPQSEHRLTQPVMVSPSGALLHTKSSVVSFSFLNSSGELMSAGAGNWREQSSFAEGNVTPRGESPDTGKDKVNPNVDKQFMVVCCEKLAKVYTLPSQVCMHSHNFSSETGTVVRASVDISLHGACLATYSSSGNVAVYRLPSLNMLLDTQYLPPNDVRISETFCFALGSQAIYMASPSEIQRMTYSVETYENMQEVIGHLFIPCESPERPNPGFFKGLFGGGHTSIDRQELFGEEQSGRASRGVAKHIPGTGGSSLEGLRTASTGMASEMQKLRLQTQERGEKLSELEEKTQKMQDSASKFSADAHALMLKYKNKKWYQM